MELSERHIQSLEAAGYRSISEEQFEAGYAWQDGTAEGEVVILVTDGSVMIVFNNLSETVVLGRRFTIPPHTTYQATAGPDGVIYITGEL